MRNRFSCESSYLLYLVWCCGCSCCGVNVERASEKGVMLWLLMLMPMSVSCSCYSRLSSPYLLTATKTGYSPVQNEDTSPITAPGCSGPQSGQT